MRFFLGEAGSFSTRAFLSRAISISVASLTGVPFPPLDPRNSQLSFIAAALASTNAGSFVSGSVSELSSDELELELELVFSFALVSARRGWASAAAARSGRFSLNFLNHWSDIFGRPRLVIRHARGNRAVVTTFCVTATVWSKLSTACHHPSGTYMISPGPCTQSIGRGNPRVSVHAAPRVFGYIRWNHVTDSPSRPIPLGFKSGLVRPASGGYRAHLL